MTLMQSSWAGRNPNLRYSSSSVKIWSNGPGSGTKRKQSSQIIPVSLLMMIATSNGDWLSQNTSFLKDISKRRLPRFSIQVVIDDRYYPKHVNTNVLRNYDCVRLCQDVQHIYPQGRALANKLPYDAQASKCFNARAVVKQLDFVSYQDLVFRYSLPYQKYCSPNIDMHGNIRVGESLLCPVCSSIYKSDREIIDDIRNFSCHGCDFLNDKLGEKYKQFL